MTEISLKINKTLVVKNAIIFTPVSNNDLPTIHQIKSHLRANNIDTEGPVIIWDKSFIKDGKLNILRKIVLRSNKEPESLDSRYQYKEIMRAGPCIYSRIVCSEGEVRHAFEKISVYAFENDIKLTDESFTVHVDGSGDQMTVDVFIPVG